jgi:hypothetical protein
MTSDSLDLQGSSAYSRRIYGRNLLPGFRLDKFIVDEQADGLGILAPVGSSQLHEEV